MTSYDDLPRVDLEPDEPIRRDTGDGARLAEAPEWWLEERRREFTGGEQGGGERAE